MPIPDASKRLLPAGMVVAFIRAVGQGHAAAETEGESTSYRNSWRHPR